MAPFPQKPVYPKRGIQSAAGVRPSSTHCVGQRTLSKNSHQALRFPRGLPPKINIIHIYSQLSFPPCADWSDPTAVEEVEVMVEEVEVEDVPCRWVPPRRFSLKPVVSRSAEQNSFEGMLANWISSAASRGCRRKWTLIDEEEVGAEAPPHPLHPRAPRPDAPDIIRSMTPAETLRRAEGRGVTVCENTAYLSPQILFLVSHKLFFFFFFLLSAALISHRRRHSAQYVALFRRFVFVIWPTLFVDQ